MVGAWRFQRPITGEGVSPASGSALSRASQRLRERGSAFPELNVSEEEVVCRP
jgi:hypothetical protein